MSDRAAIIPDMPIFGSDGVLVGTVHRVSGVRIIVSHVGVSDADQHVIPLARVASVTDRVTLDCPAADVRPAGAGEAGSRRGIVPFAWLGIGLVGIVFAVGVTRMILNAPRPAASPSAPAPVPSSSASPTVAKPVAVRAASLATAKVPGGPLEANPASLGSFLLSDMPAPQRFALDTEFAAGSAELGAAGMAAVRGIAGVLTTHLNTKIKLAASGGLGLRRAAAIKRALIGAGVADYRIATGPGRSRGGAAGVELIVLAK